MKIGSEILINDLISRTTEILKKSQTLVELSENELNYRISAESWSSLECLEHLNLYGRFYIKEMNRRMLESSKQNTTVFKSGLLGNYFAKSMLPKAKLNTMKTFSNMNPINSSLDKRVIEEFIQQQKEMLQLLETARKKNLNKIKCGITISKMLKLKLGDTFRFVIYHNERHMKQIDRVLTAVTSQQ